MWKRRTGGPKDRPDPPLGDRDAVELEPSRDASSPASLKPAGRSIEPLGTAHQTLEGCGPGSAQQVPAPPAGVECVEHTPADGFRSACVEVLRFTNCGSHFGGNHGRPWR